jgi:Zn-finger nucleic acid-binding protein
MHQSTSRFIVGIVAFLALTFMSGCASQKATSLRMESQNARAVSCPKCTTVWIDSYDMNDPYMMTITTSPVTQCAGCEEAAANFFKTGRIAHGCSICGEDLQLCEVH